MKVSSLVKGPAGVAERRGKSMPNKNSDRERQLIERLKYRRRHEDNKQRQLSDNAKEAEKRDK